MTRRIGQSDPSPSRSLHVRVTTNLPADAYPLHLASTASHDSIRQTRITYYNSSSSSRNLLRVTRDDLIRMFPPAADGYADYDQWLREAAETVIDIADDAKPEIIAETLLTIALAPMPA